MLPERSEGRECQHPARVLVELTTHVTAGVAARNSPAAKLTHSSTAIGGGTES